MIRHLFLVLSLLHSAFAIANCTIVSGNVARTPDGDFTNGTNQITHTKTGLIWKECVEGLSGDNACTTGTAAGTYTWQQALQLATGNWRLPSRNELLSIVETGCSSNMINTTLFPNSPPSGTFWTSTPMDQGNPTAAWAVRFGDGRVEGKEKSSLNYVRLVSSGTVDETFNSTSSPAGGPNAYSFVANTNATSGALTTSTAIVLSGVTGTVPISVSGGEYLISPKVTFSNATETVNRAAHGFAFGDTVAFGTTGALPSGINAGTNYYVTGKNSNGSTITFTDATEAVNWTSHGLTGGNRVVFTNAGGALPTGISAGTTYYAVGKKSSTATVTFTDATETVNWTAHGLADGTAVVFANSGGALPTNITAGTTYYVTGKNSLGSSLTFTDTGDIVNWTGHGLSAGTAIQFTNAGGGLPTNLTAGTTYYVKATGLTTNSFTVSATAGTDGAIRTFTGAGTGTHTAWTNFVLPNSFSVSTTAAAIQAVAFTGAGTGTHSISTITFDDTGDVVNWPNHGLPAGTAVAFTTAGTLPTSTLTAGTIYYVRGDASLTTNSFTLVTTRGGSTVRTFTGAGSGVHTVWTDYLDSPNSFSVSNASTSLQHVAFTGAGTGTHTVWTDMVLADSFSISSTPGGIQALAFSSDGTGTHYLDGGAWTTTAGTIGNDVLQVRLTAGVAGTTSIARVNINGIISDYLATVPAAAPEPTPFAFGEIANVTPGSVVESPEVTVTGLTTSRAVTVVCSGCTNNPQFRIYNGTSWSAWGTSGNISNSPSGQKIQVRQTASASASTRTTATVSINGNNFPFYVRTNDNVVDPFYFEEKYNADLNKGSCATDANNCPTSATVTLEGLPANSSSNTMSVSYLVTGGVVKVNGGAWGAAPATFPSDSTGKATVAVRVATPNKCWSPSWADVTVNGITSRFTAWTGSVAATGPAAMTFAALTGQATNTFVFNATAQTASPLSATSCIVATGGYYSLPSVTNSADATNNLINWTNHGLSAGSRVRFTATTIPTGLTANQDYYVIDTGMTANAFKVSTTEGGSEVDITAAGGGLVVWTTGPGWIANNNTIRIGQVSSSSSNQTTRATVFINGQAFDFDVTTSP